MASFSSAPNLWVLLGLSLAGILLMTKAAKVDFAAGSSQGPPPAHRPHLCRLRPVVIPLGLYENYPVSVSLMAKHGADEAGKSKTSNDVSKEAAAEIAKEKVNTIERFMLVV
ncbi:hypothetical protein Hanom_Chr05g00419171 [Helianthus anomalus]